MRRIIITMAAIHENKTEILSAYHCQTLTMGELERQHAVVVVYHPAANIREDSLEDIFLIEQIDDLSAIDFSQGNRLEIYDRNNLSYRELPEPSPISLVNGMLTSRRNEEEIDQTPWYKKLFKLLLIWFSISVEAELGAASLPILMATLLFNLQREESLKLKEKLLMTLLAWQFFAVIDVWIGYNLVGKRVGEADNYNPAKDAGSLQKPLALTAILLASFSKLAEGFITGFAVSPSFKKPTGSLVGIVIAILFWQIFMLSQAVAAFALYARDSGAVPLPAQRGIGWFYRKSRPVAMILRETLAPVMATLGAFNVLRLIFWLMDKENFDMEVMKKYGVLLSILAIVCYLVSARITNGFDIRQMSNNLVTVSSAQRMQIEAVPYLARTRQPLLRLIGRFLRGFVLDDLVVRFKFKLNTFIWVICFINILNILGVTNSNFQNYFFRAGGSQKKGLMVFYFGNEEEKKIADDGAVIVQAVIALIIGMMESLSKRNNLIESMQEAQRAGYTRGTFGEDFIQNPEARRVGTQDLINRTGTHVTTTPGIFFTAQGSVLSPSPEQNLLPSGQRALSP